MWFTNFDTQYHKNVQENMDKDLKLVQNLPLQNRHFHCYIYPKRAITFGFNQDLPADLKPFDCGQRPTGGGIVFHAPQDMVFSLMFHANDPWFPHSLRDLSWLTQHLKTFFLKAGISPQSHSPEKEKNIQFCSSYINPFELYYQNSKLLGISARKFRKKCLIQCIIHLGNGLAAFPEIPQYYSQIAKGIPFPIKIKQFQELFLDHVAQLPKISTAPWL